MPSINEIMDETTGRDSNETSLQISSTSPEVPVGRAMHVRKTSSKTSRTSSSSSTGRHQSTDRVTSRASTPKGPSHRNRGVASLPIMDRQSSQDSSAQSVP